LEDFQLFKEQVSNRRMETTPLVSVMITKLWKKLN